MNLDYIIAFLTVVDKGTISAAAESLFLTQSTVSTRIKLLEDELSVPLLERQQGKRSISLTKYGKEFVPIAEKFKILYEKSYQLKRHMLYDPLVIDSVDNVSNYTLMPFFREVLEKIPTLDLTLRTFHSAEIYERVLDSKADFGIIWNPRAFRNIVSKPLYQEEMYLLCRKDAPYYDHMKVEDLDRHKEVHINWSTEYEKWYNEHFNLYKKPHLTINTGSAIEEYTIGDKWAIAPISIIKALSQVDQFTYYKLDSPIPPNTCYIIRRRDHKVNEVGEEFLSLLNNYISECDWLDNLFQY